MKQQILEETVEDMLRVLEEIKRLALSAKNDKMSLMSAKLHLIVSDADNTIYNVKQRLGK